MESSSAESLRDAERAETAPFVDCAPTPWWYPPAGGLWFGALVANSAALYYGDLGGLLLGLALVAQCLLFAFLGATARWLRHRRGGSPSTRHAPHEIRRAHAEYGVACVALVIVVAAAWLLFGHGWASCVAVVLCTALLWWHERRYVDAARRTRERLS